MKYYLLRNNQITEHVYGGRGQVPLYTGIRHQRVIVPKELVQDSSVPELEKITYDVVLRTVESPFDLIPVTNNFTSTVFVDSDNNIKILGPVTIMCLEEDVIERLGYETKELGVFNGGVMNIAIESPVGEYYRFNNYLGIDCKQDKLVELTNALFDKGYIEQVEISARYKNDIVDEDGYPESRYYTINKSNIKYILEELSDKKNKVKINNMKFAKIFDKTEANDILKIFKGFEVIDNDFIGFNISFTGFSITRMKIEKLYVAI